MARPVAPLLVGAAAVAGCVAVAAADPTSPDSPLPTCPTKALFGVNCPVCGSTRMVYSLTQFDLASAFRYNALGVLALVLLTWSWVAWLASTLGKRVPVWTSAPGIGWWLAGLVGLWTVVRLLPWEPFRSLQV